MSRERENRPLERGGNEHQAQFWDRRAQRYDGEIVRHDDLYKRTIEGTRPLLTDSDVVLDLGCGSGEIALDLASHVSSLHGIDVSDGMIELARDKADDRGVDSVEFRRGDAFDRSLTPGMFTVVIAFNVLHLVDDIPAVLTRLHELLRSGGLLISQTPCLGERALWVRSTVRLAEHVGLTPPIHSLSFAELESSVSDAGLEIVHSAMSDDRDAVRRLVARKPGGGRPIDGIRATAASDRPAKIHYGVPQ